MVGFIFYYFLSDTLLHEEPEDIDHQMHVAILTNVTNLLKATFTKTPVYAAFGNHDADVADQLEPRNTVLYNEAWSMWQSWINDGTQEISFRSGK